jgi:hypothetical protein
VSVGKVIIGEAGTAAKVTNVGTPQAAILNFTFPPASLATPGPAGYAGAGRIVFVGTLHQDALTVSGPEFVPLNTAGDPTGNGQHPLFEDNVTLMPISCTSLSLYAFQGSQSGADVTVTLFRSEGGTGPATSTGLSITVANGAGSHAELAYPIAAGDLLAYQVSGPNVAASGIKLSLGLVCH